MQEPRKHYGQPGKADHAIAKEKSSIYRQRIFSSAADERNTKSDRHWETEYRNTKETDAQMGERSTAHPGFGERTWIPGQKPDYSWNLSSARRKVLPGNAREHESTH
ncbi:hypothetical protein MJO28_007970 [Puccinia striiformis f. sp. tritici]|uniref:Uncharacterized protein n=1 Tax=Puccinia striiformis f. sp. tritici TaxID=168172 RepID=A0ACC0E9L0_9BASI|nr:hypothetical protein MJO28_007970 [Puccinia striiformis f. sp. tritici]